MCLVHVFKWFPHGQCLQLKLHFILRVTQSSVQQHAMAVIQCCMWYVPVCTCKVGREEAEQINPFFFLTIKLPSLIFESLTLPQLPMILVEPSISLWAAKHCASCCLGTLLTAHSCHCPLTPRMPSFYQGGFV